MKDKKEERKLDKNEKPFYITTWWNTVELKVAESQKFHEFNSL